MRYYQVLFHFIGIFLSLVTLKIVYTKILFGTHPYVLQNTHIKYIVYWIQKRQIFVHECSQQIYA